jgi:hypothetical protein
MEEEKGRDPKSYRVRREREKRGERNKQLYTSAVVMPRSPLLTMVGCMVVPGNMKGIC